MKEKRKAVANNDGPGQRQRRSREEEALEDTATSGRTETAGSLGTLQELEQELQPAVGLPSGVSSQFGGALDRGGVSGTGHGGFSQSTPMVQPPVGNPDAAGDAQIGNARNGPPQQAQGQHPEPEVVLDLHLGQPGQQASSEPDNPGPPPPPAGQS